MVHKQFRKTPKRRYESSTHHDQFNDSMSNSTRWWHCLFENNNLKRETEKLTRDVALNIVQNSLVSVVSLCSRKRAPKSW